MTSTVGITIKTAAGTTSEKNEIKIKKAGNPRNQILKKALVLQKTGSKQKTKIAVEQKPESRSQIESKRRTHFIATQQYKHSARTSTSISSCISA